MRSLPWDGFIQDAAARAPALAELTNYLNAPVLQDSLSDALVTGQPELCSFIDRLLPGVAKLHEWDHMPTHAEFWDVHFLEECDGPLPFSEVSRSFPDAPTPSGLSPITTKAGSRLWSISFVTPAQGPPPPSSLVGLPSPPHPQPPLPVSLLCLSLPPPIPSFVPTSLIRRPHPFFVRTPAASLGARLPRSFPPSLPCFFVRPLVHPPLPPPTALLSIFIPAGVYPSSLPPPPPLLPSSPPASALDQLKTWVFFSDWKNLLPPFGVCQGVFSCCSKCTLFSLSCRLSRPTAPCLRISAPWSNRHPS